MGTAVRMAQKRPGMFRGMVLLALMLSLEEVKKARVCCCVRNGHLEPVADFLDWAIPTVPLLAPARNTIHPLSQKECDDDPLNYHGKVRIRMGNAFRKVTDRFMEGGLTDVRTPFVTIHAVRDTFTDPYGSKRL